MNKNKTQSQTLIKRKITGSHTSADKDSSLLGCYTVSTSK